MFGSALRTIRRVLFTSSVAISLIWLAACEAEPLDQILASKACSASGECAAGYVCDLATNVCVTHLNGTGGATSSSSTGRSDGTCVLVSDCAPLDTKCQAPICVGGLCGTTAVVMGTDSGDGTPNDCKKSICDGQGNEVTVNDPTDLPVQAVCSMGSCDNGAPLFRPAAPGSTCSDNGGALCDSSSNCVQCLGEADCTTLPPDDECKARICSSAGACGQNFTPIHTPVSAQNQGDCKQNVCNGSGDVISEPLVSDVPDDGNDCTTQTCKSDGTIQVQNAQLNTPCSAGFCDDNGHCTGCVNAADCGTDTPCSTWACLSGGVCQQTALPDTTYLPANQQVAGDCQVRKCDGSGQVVTVALDTDVPPDDGIQCTKETCSSGTPQHPPQPFDHACSQNGTVCDGSGACVQCNSAGECANQGGICAHATCAIATHTCGLANTPNNTPAPTSAQTTGDCELLVCNGQGVAVAQPDNNDLPLDSDDCTSDKCTMGVPSNPNAPPGTPCGSDGFCDGNDGCSAKKGLGIPCSLDAECDSGHCPTADGVCCDGLCNGTCQACTNAKSGGVNGMCTSIPVGQDPDSECMQAGQSCNGSGACAFTCGQSPTPPQAMCPAACTGGCAGGVCFITCNDPASCSNAALACPAGLSCTVQCGALGACNNTTITCPDAYACSLVCGNGACSVSTNLTCATGTCSVQCSDPTSCAGAAVTCGPNTCSATCASGASHPAVTCGSSCNCGACQ